MDANRRELLLQKEVYAVVGCAIEVLNVRGHGLHEKSMRTACVWSFVCAGFPSLNRSDTRFCTKASWSGEYVPDLVVQQKLIVDTKTIDHITDHERGQMLNYLRITNLPVGIILNFKHARLEWERLVLSGERILDGSKDELIL